MKSLFYFLTILPISLIRYLVVFIIFCRLHIKSNLYRITLININLCYPDLDDHQKIKLANDSVIETNRGLQLITLHMSYTVR